MTNATQRNTPATIVYTTTIPVRTRTAVISELPQYGKLKQSITVHSDGTVDDKHVTSDARGYQYVAVAFENGVYKSIGIHRLIAYAFNQQWSSHEDGTNIHHIDSDPTNNSADNLMLTSASDNVKRYFDGRDNEAYINSQRRFQTKMTESRLNPVMLVVPDDNGSWHIVADYRISADGRVWKVKQGELKELKSSVANSKYPTNRNVKIAGTTYSLAGLVAFNFMAVPDGRYKTLMIDQGTDNPWDATNLYTVPVKQFDK